MVIGKDENKPFGFLRFGEFADNSDVSYNFVYSQQIRSIKMKQIVVFCATTILLVSGCASVVRPIHTGQVTTNSINVGIH